MNETIGYIHKCKPIQDAQYSLQIWYNNLLKKREDELTTFDVIRMLRQKKFVDLAVKKALEFLIYNPFAGDCFAGELLEKLIDIDSTIVQQNRTIIYRIILLAQEKNR